MFYLVFRQNSSIVGAYIEWTMSFKLTNNQKQKYALARRRRRFVLYYRC